MAKQAINAPRQNVFLLDPDELILIGRDTKDSTGHARYDIRVHNNFDEAIVQGILRFGPQEAVKCVKVGDALEVYDGRQRVINTREANRRLREQGLPIYRVKVLLGRCDDAQCAALMVVLNEHRVEDSAYGRGQKAQALLDRGYSEEEVAGFFKVSVGTLKNYLSLLDLKPEVKKLVIEGKVVATKGYELAAKGEAAQKAFLTRLETGSRSGPPKRTPSTKAMRKLVEEGTLPEHVLLGIKFALGDVTLDELTKASKKPEAEPVFQVVKSKMSKNPFLAED